MEQLILQRNIENDQSMKTAAVTKVQNMFDGKYVHIDFV